MCHRNAGCSRMETDRPLLFVRPKPLRPTRHAITIVSTIDRWTLSRTLKPRQGSQTGRVWTPLQMQGVFWRFGRVIWFRRVSGLVMRLSVRRRPLWSQGIRSRALTRARGAVRSDGLPNPAFSIFVHNLQSTVHTFRRSPAAPPVVRRWPEPDTPHRRASTPRRRGRFYWPAPRQPASLRGNQAVFRQVTPAAPKSPAFAAVQADLTS